MRLDSYYEVSTDDWRGTEQSGIIRNNKEKVDSGQSDEPEEFVRQWVWNELIESYDIPESQIKPEVEVKVKEREQSRRADLVVYRDDEFKVPFIVVETKPPGEAGAPKEAEWYASVLRATYALGTNGDLTATDVSILEGKSPERSTALPDLPQWTETSEPKVTELQPFGTRDEITDVFRECHNIIRDNDGLDPIKAFEEMSKLLLAKYADEKTTGKSDEYDFQRLRKVEPNGEVEEEDPNETAQRVRQLFDRFVEEFIADDEGVFDEGEGIDLSNTSITAGGSNKTSVLILEKVENPRESYPVLLSVVKYVGYDTANRPIEENELPKLPSIIRPFISNGEVPEPDTERLGFVKDYSDLGENLTPDYHLPATSEGEEHETSTLGELCERIFYGKSPKRDDYLTEPGIPVVKKTNLTGGGIDFLRDQTQ